MWLNGWPTHSYHGEIFFSNAGWCLISWRPGWKLTSLAISWIIIQILIHPSLAILPNILLVINGLTPRPRHCATFPLPVVRPCLWTYWYKGLYIWQVRYTAKGIGVSRDVFTLSITYILKITFVRYGRSEVWVQSRLYLAVYTCYILQITCHCNHTIFFSFVGELHNVD